MGDKNSATKIPMDGTEKAAVIIGLGFLVLVGVIFVVTLEKMNSSTDFLTVWTAVGPIVGVVIGSMPAYFFRDAIKTANSRADHANTRADDANTRADQMTDKMADMAEKMVDMGVASK